MFTGLVRSIGTLARRGVGDDQQILVIEAALSQGDRSIGASVAIAGVCLTITEATESSFEVHAAFETLEKTTLGSKAVGDRVNLEPALRVGDPLGGHLVSGHVDGVGRVRSVEGRGDAKHVWVSLPDDLPRYVAAKGSVTIDGTSLTVNEVDRSGFSVGLIPHTLSVTTLGSLAAGDAINIEVDVLARYVARLLDRGEDGSLREALAESWGVRA